MMTYDVLKYSHRPCVAVVSEVRFIIFNRAASGIVSRCVTVF